MSKSKNSVIKLELKIEKDYGNIHHFISETRETIYSAMLDGFKMLIDSGVDSVELIVNGTAENINWDTKYSLDLENIHSYGDNLMDYFIEIEAFEKCELIKSLKYKSHLTN